MKAVVVMLVEETEEEERIWCQLSRCRGDSIRVKLRQLTIIE